MSRLGLGLYERLLTEAVEAELGALDETRRARVDALDADAAAEVLARFVHDRLLVALRGLRGEDRLEQRVAVTDAVLARVRELVGDGSVVEGDRVASPARQLTAVYDPRPGGLGVGGPPPRPRIPLRTSDLLINGPRDLRLGAELQRELASADRVDLLVSFLKWSGVRVLEEALQDFVRRCPGGLRVLTTAYLGATDPEALEHLHALGAAIRVSYDTRRTRLHAKAWLFHRDSGYSTGFVGSSNLSAPAMLDGLEWNVRLSEIDNHPVLAKFRAAFEQYWEEGEFAPYDADEFRRAVKRERSDAATIIQLSIRPFRHQLQLLDALDAEREAGHHRNLVVAATGTGKTIVAALDYRRLRGAHGPLSLLVVAHRREILEQARHAFRVVLQDGSFGELLVGDRRPSEGAHVFASIQSLHEARLEGVRADAFDMVIVDEFHHAAAPSYDRLLTHLRPRWLLGLTATPERADGRSVLGWFDGRVAAELRLWTALDRGLLVPFQYFGVSDGTDLSRLAWRRGGYVPEELENIYTADDARLRLVLAALRRRVADPSRMRALGFCVSVAHARFMARRFTEAGLPSRAVSGETSTEARDEALLALRSGALRVLFTVDLFNEGVDLPDVDTLLLLRPTASATLFLQQLGRGLRHADGKACLTVLDFIGQSHRSFRFDLQYRAILGGTRRELAERIEDGFPQLPPGCSMQLDRQAREIVLDNVRRALDLGWRGLADELRGLGDVDLPRFLERAGVELQELYRGGRGWSELRRAAGLPTPPDGPQEAALTKALGRMIHVDDAERLDTWSRWLTAERPPTPARAGSREERLQWMLFMALGHVRRPLAELPEALAELWEHPAIRAELVELLALLGGRRRHRSLRLEAPAAAPIAVHAHYTLDEIMAGFGVVRSGKVYRSREGVWYEAPANTDLLFVTLDKTESEYSPTTRYEDYPISPTEFHWQTQNVTTPTSKTGRRYVDGTSQVLLFVRRRRKDERGVTEPYLCLGPAVCERHASERPMNIVWRLRWPMPMAWFDAVKLAAG